eukprot:m.135060 g.135060  ORF g.135060 m.135060 type:complete len:108 (+) comp9818_c0_seq1:328-651(+)
MSFFQRIASYLANHFAADALAKNKAFQRFASFTHMHVSKASEKSAEAAAKLKTSGEAKKILDETTKTASTIQVFFRSFADNVKKNYKELEEEGKRLEEMERTKKQQK